MTIAAIWDMDGVLVDTEQFHYQSWAEALAPIGVPLTFHDFSATFGMNNTSTLKRWLGPDTPQATIDRIGDQKEEIFRRMVTGQVQVLPGVRALLDALRQAGVRQAVGSSAPQANIDVLLAATGLRPYFDAVVSAWAMPGKPNPAVFLEAAAQLDVPPARCVVIEDSIAGVEGAHRGGMQCIAVTNTHPAALLSAASLVVPSLEEVSAETVAGLI
jgi:beta-phosphoglucomutase